MRYAELMNDEYCQYDQNPSQTEYDVGFAFFLPVPWQLDRIRTLFAKICKKMIYMTVCETETVHSSYGTLLDISNVIYCPSEFARGVLSHQFPSGDFRVLRHWIPDPPVPKCITDGPTEKFYYKFYSIGNLADPRKNIGQLIQAFLDLNLPDGSGYELVSWARKVARTIAIVVLTLNDGADYVRAAKGAGANAFIVKSAPLSDLLAALDLALSSQSLFSSKSVSPLAIDSGLSAREIDVLQLINVGSSNGAIARNLFISVSTVKTHVSSILRKLDAGNRVQALKIARERGLLIE